MYVSESGRNNCQTHCLVITVSRAGLTDIDDLPCRSLRDIYTAVHFHRSYRCKHCMLSFTTKIHVLVYAVCELINSACIFYYFRHKHDSCLLSTCNESL
jgi:hypothetical protein